jgi:hypothetical protein
MTYVPNNTYSGYAQGSSMMDAAPGAQYIPRNFPNQLGPNDTSPRYAPFVLGLNPMQTQHQTPLSVVTFMNSQAGNAVAGPFDGATDQGALNYHNGNAAQSNDMTQNMDGAAELQNPDSPLSPLFVD